MSFAIPELLLNVPSELEQSLTAQTWNPAWGEYAGDSQGLVLMQMENGVRAFYEGAKTNAKEFVRVLLRVFAPSRLFKNQM